MLEGGFQTEHIMIRCPVPEKKKRKRTNKLFKRKMQLITHKAIRTQQDPKKPNWASHKIGSLTLNDSGREWQPIIKLINKLSNAKSQILDKLSGIKWLSLRKIINTEKKTQLSTWGCEDIVWRRKKYLNKENSQESYIRKQVSSRLAWASKDDRLMRLESCLRPTGHFLQSPLFNRTSG